MFTDIYAAVATWAGIGVWIDGVYSTTLACAANGTNFVEMALSAGTKTIEFVSGPHQLSGTVLGTYLVSVRLFGDNAATVTAPTATNRLLIYGDSIASGYISSPVQQNAWSMLIRDARGTDSTMIEAYGGRKLLSDCADEAARIAFAARLASFAPSIIWLAIGTNDISGWANPAAFGVAYADLMDRLHAALPSAAIYAQTPILRTTDGSLSDFRAQIATAAGARAWSTLVDGTAAAFPQPANLDVDGIHPTTAGHAMYAAAVSTILGL